MRRKTKNFQYHNYSNNLWLRHNEFVIQQIFNVEPPIFNVEQPMFDIVQVACEMVLSVFVMGIYVLDMVQLVLDMVHNIEYQHTKFVDTYIGFHKKLVD